MRIHPPDHNGIPHHRVPHRRRDPLNLRRCRRFANLIGDTCVMRQPRQTCARDGAAGEGEQEERGQDGAIPIEV